MAASLLAVYCVLGAQLAAANGYPSRPWAHPFEQMLRSAIEPAVLAILKSVLELSENQSHALDQLQSRHEDEFAEFVNQSKHVVADMNRQLADAKASARQSASELGKAEVEFALHPDGDPDAVAEAAARALAANTKLLEKQIERETKLAEIADAQVDLDERFFSELEALLTEEQSEKMPRVRNELRRRAWLGKTGLYAEEGIDLILLVEKIVEELELDLESAELDDLLLSYSQQIIVPLNSLAEQAIRRSRRYYREHDEAEHFIPGEKGLALDYSADTQYVAQFKREIATTQRLHRAIRDLNRSHKPAVEALLPEAMRPRFHEAYMALALRSHVRLSAIPAQQFVQQVLEVDSLSPRQSRDIEELAAAHLASVAMAQDRILRCADSVSDVQLDAEAGRSKRAELQGKLDTALESYRQSEADFIEVVWMLLSSEQQSQIAKPTLEELPR
jgi:hypothetical protein